MDWSIDFDSIDPGIPEWFHPGTNCMLDFHGDPLTSQLVVFSDGNHNMALTETLNEFKRRTPELGQFFYTTTPPAPILSLLDTGNLRLGNLVLSIKPHLFMGPPDVLDSLVATGVMPSHFPFVKNQGNVLLVRKTNPAGISGVGDLPRKGITLFLSNPDTERASYTAYARTLVNLSGDKGFLSKPTLFFGTKIHHREAPEALIAGKADVAVLFYHLARHLVKCFPNDLEMIPLGGTVDHPEPEPGNLIGKTHAGIIGNGGIFGQRLLNFLNSSVAGSIYRKHGLIPLT